MQPDYSAEVSRLYSNCGRRRLSLNEEYALRAGIVVERLFPPSTADEAFQILASLNLLNAVVKQPWGRRLVTYSYIKGMAANMLQRLLLFPIDGVNPYWDSVERIVYFSVWGVQVSFHYIPMSCELLGLLATACLPRQRWTGLQLQKIAVELFNLAVGTAVSYSRHDEQCVRYVMSRGSEPCDSLPAEEHYDDPGSKSAFQPFSEDKMLSLHTALHFHIWRQGVFTLWRRKDNRPMPVVRYDGSNYEVVMDYLLGGDQRIPQRPRKRLIKGAFYYVSPQKRITCLNRSSYVLRLAQNSYLRTREGYRNLCVTYGIVRYLGLLYPTLKFVCTLNINHMAEQRVFYTFNELCRVPLPSPARMLKVWIVMDTKNQLDDFSIDMLPQVLVDDYLQAEDYYQEFEVVDNGWGRKGIVAYRRYTILPTAYLDIRLFNYHAHVLGDNGLWAIFSLNQEQFTTGFIFSSIWYDSCRAAIMGLVDGYERVIYAFRLQRY